LWAPKLKVNYFRSSTPTCDGLHGQTRRYPLAAGLSTP